MVWATKLLSSFLREVPAVFEEAGFNEERSGSFELQDEGGSC